MSGFSPREQEGPMKTLCRMVYETQYEDLPAAVVSFAKHAILDTMGVIIGGSALEGIPVVVDLVKEKGGKPESIVPFYGLRVPASEAGFAIGPMARAMDLGDVHEEASHCSEYTVPTLLAATGLKDKVSGKELITAYMVGQEVLIRIGMAYKGVSRGVPMGRGTGHSIFGAVAAAGKLLGLSLRDLRNAQGIARGMTQTHDLSMYKPATLMVRIHHGFVCQDAINACLLSMRGVTGPCQDVLMGPKGYLGFAKWETDAGALTERLSKDWVMAGTAMKAYTACKGTHTSMEGLLDQMKEHHFEVEDIARIEFDESSVNWVLVCEPIEEKWNPQTVSECQFSLPYVVATAAHDKHIFLDSYTPEARQRRDVRELMLRISAREDPTLPPYAARVSVNLKDGERITKEYLYSKGHPKNPFTTQELIHKFKRCVPYCACKLTDETVDSVIEALIHLEEVENVVEALLLRLSPQIPVSD